MINKIVVAVKGVILFNKRALILKRSDKDDVSPGSWEFIGGKIEFGEKLEDALIREAKEEAGLDIRVVKILFATTFKTDPTRQLVLINYLCEAANDTVKLSFEHSDYLWANEAQLKKLLYPDILSDFKKYGAFPIEGLD